MKILLLLFLSTLAFMPTLGAESEHDEIKQQLNNLSEQMDRIELLLNNSISQLLGKIDDSNHDIIQLIKVQHAEPTEDNRQSSARPISALLVIDVQNDFIDGSLSLRNCPSKHNGEEVVPVINDLLDSGHFDVVVYSHDWHPSNHISFFDNLHLRSHLLTNDSTPFNQLHLYSKAQFDIPNVAVLDQILWPRHCVQNTTGAKVHPDLKVVEDSSTQSVIHILKGTKPDIDSYSAFWDNSKLSETALHKQLKEKNVTQIFVTGLATDYCVYSTAVHALEHGYKTFMIEDACRGVDEKTIKERLQDFTEKDGHIIQSSQVQDYTS